VVDDIEYAVLVMPTTAAPPSPDLSEAERQVVELVLTGLSNEAIAARRGTSARTVANQLQSIYRKLGVASRLELATALRRSKPS
jgi:DNA-binding NarL/FixJ family response regulator